MKNIIMTYKSTIIAWLWITITFLHTKGLIDAFTVEYLSWLILLVWGTVNIVQNNLNK